MLPHRYYNNGHDYVSYLKKHRGQPTAKLGYAQHPTTSVPRRPLKEVRNTDIVIEMLKPEKAHLKTSARERTASSPSSDRWRTIFSTANSL
jgi:hypothetical protein